MTETTDKLKELTMYRDYGVSLLKESQGRYNESKREVDKWIHTNKLPPPGIIDEFIRSEKLVLLLENAMISWENQITDLS